MLLACTSSAIAIATPAAITHDAEFAYSGDLPRASQLLPVLAQSLADAINVKVERVNAALVVEGGASRKLQATKGSYDPKADKKLKIKFTVQCAVVGCKAEKAVLSNTKNDAFVQTINAYFTKQTPRWPLLARQTTAGSQGQALLKQPKIVDMPLHARGTGMAQYKYDQNANCKCPEPGQLCCAAFRLECLACARCCSPERLCELSVFGSPEQRMCALEGR